MNSTAAILTILGLSFGAVYPLCLWLNQRAIIQRYYYYHLLAACVGGLIGFGLMWYFEVGMHLRISGLIWLIALFTTTGFYWRHALIQPLVVSVPSIFGLIVLYQVGEILLFPSVAVFLVQILGALLIGAVLVLLSTVRKAAQADNAGIPIRPALWFMAILMLGRFLWIFYSVYMGQLEQVRLDLVEQEFFIDTQVYLLGAGILLGLILPALSILILHLQIKSASLKPALNLLYPLAVSVLSSELIFKYCLFQFGTVI